MRQMAQAADSAQRPSSRHPGTASRSRSGWPVLWACVACCALLPGGRAVRPRAIGGTLDNGVPADDDLPANTRGLGPEVTVAQGRLLGRTLVTTKGTAYEAFSGIPYAAPPVGDLRFKGPRPPSSWDGVRDARREGRACTQPILNLTRILVTRLAKSMEPLHLAELPGLVRVQPWLLQAVAGILTSGEDCLFLNVYTPRVAARVSRSAGAPGLPVLFWVYGGGFVWGEGGLAFYDPDNLMDQGMVVVTFNYRLGPLGFLSMGRGSGASGNAGIKDQAAALRWVRDNIARFGGDPSRITIYGESAGAVGTHLHLLNEKSASMLHGAIVASGSAVHWWSTVTADVAKRRARTLARWLGCRAEAAADLVQCLRRAPAHKLMRLHEKALSPEDWRFLPGRVAFVPSVEEADDQADEWDAPYLTAPPRDLLVAGKTANVPLMLGFNSGEALILYTGLTREPNEDTLMMMHTNVTSMLPDEIFDRLGPEDAEALARRIKRFYFGNEQPITPAQWPTFFEMSSGYFMYLDMLMLSRYMAAVATPASAPVYLYRFSYVGALNVFKNLLRIMSNETSHADELPYVWRMNVAPASRPLGPHAPEYKVRDTFTSVIANFVKTGSPTPPSSALDFEWPAFTAAEQAYLDISERPRVQRDYRHDAVAFWDEIHAKVVGGPLYTKLAEMEAQRRAAGLDAAAADAVDANTVKKRRRSRRRKGNAQRLSRRG